MLNCNDPARQTEILWTKVRVDADAHELWGSAIWSVQNADSEKYRNPNFRRRMLLPNDQHPTDKNIYCIEPSGEYYAVISKLAWLQLCRREMLAFVLSVYQKQGDLHIGRGSVTICLVDFLGESWVKYMRTGEANPSVPCALAAILETKKLGINGHGFKRNNHYYRIVDTKQLPIKGMSLEQAEFHRAWNCKNLCERFRTALWVHYVPTMRAKDKAEALALTKDGYSFLVDDAHEAIMRIIAARAQLNE